MHMIIIIMSGHAKEQKRMNFQREMVNHIKVHVQILSPKIALQLVSSVTSLKVM